MSREILAPPLQRMDNNRCYRVNLIHEDFGNQLADMQRQRHQQDTKPTGNAYMEQDLYDEDDDDEHDEGGDFNLEELPNGHYKLTMHVAPSFYGGLIGFKGTTKRRIESETQTDIYIPRSREGGQKQADDVTIKGKTRSTVMAARRKINLLLISLRKRMRPTHFTCVPLNYGEVKERFIAMKKQILALNLPGIDENLFQSDDCIHLTLITCVLLDDAERARAVEVLQSCKSFLADLQTPFQIQVRGLEIMNDDPSSVRVLYARIDAPELKKFGDMSMQPFLRSGLGFDDHERGGVKLHMTIMNSRHRKQIDAKAADSFDAREILKRFGDYNFGKVECSEVHLCVMHHTSGDERGAFYRITGSLKF
ncbi:PREDICTED: activating signal cointegrator 1 complex subunit 1 [Rhagoletis zephyria]|uniref:activating signal cointegrator 1 complex subunit 1 n=1 Tax=Rhagoletis zephyria TaxID=28612 RepID=UPI00081135F2|nr:PREDICTED: activating signal cointegrator 1 complex subunit 1 [Rhagoletis zephyria]XP_036331010.1 activating signal cointegrator 1 complex subunit 1 [Rhagoletis pomonella]